MTTPVPCPNCSAKLKLPEHAFGKPVTCPKCQARVTVPKPGEFDVVDDSGFEEVDEREELVAPARPRKAAARPRPAVDDEDEDYDDRPRRRRGAGRAPAKRGVPAWAFAVGGVALVLLVVGGGVGLWLLGAADPSPPAGFTTAKSRAGGYRVFLPGSTAGAMQFNAAARDGTPVDTKMFGHSNGAGRGELNATVHSTPVSNLNGPAGSMTGTTQDEMLALFKADGGWQYFDKSHTAPEIKAITIGGQPGIEVRSKDKPGGMFADDPMDAPWPAGGPPLPPPDPEFERQFRENRDAVNRNIAAQEARDARAFVFLFTVRDGRMYKIELTKQGDYADAATVETVRSSFTFLAGV